MYAVASRQTSSSRRQRRPGTRGSHTDMAAADTAEPRASAPPAPCPDSRDIAKLEREVRDAHHRWLALFHGPDFCLCWSGGRDGAAAAAAAAARDPDRWEAMV